MPQVNIHWTKNRPSRTAAPRAWEKTWESDFSRNMYIYESFPGSIVDHVPTDLAVAGSQGNNAAVLAGEIAQVCKLQQGLAQMMLVVFPGGTIESQWRALSRARREEVVLAGILRTFRNDWMEDRRQWCPETTLRNLTSRNGEEFLTIVHALKPARADILPTEPLHLPHATIDRIFTPTADDLQKPGCDSVIATFKMVRTYTITATIWNVLHELVGGNYSLVGNRAVPTNVIAPTPGAPSHIVPAPQANPRGPGITCTFCMAGQASLGEGRAMQTCSACRKIGRNVYYCSRECQAMDWKYGGGPTGKHKETCGKAIDPDLATA